MPLSSELVSQFAKLANNKPKEEKESTKKLINID